MKINIKDAPSRSETIIRNIVYAVRATAIMTEYYLRSFPVVFFYVLMGFALAFDSTGVPLATLLQQGMLTKEGANKQVISSQADSLIKISRIWADFFPANTSNQPI
ncbi:hypothetical protein [Klebsiella pneumoniae]|nr:hypothetical protein [Klebsiella pneumoniae]